MTTEDALWKELETHSDPPEITLQMALADHYREQERWWLAHAVKWCIENRRWPRLRRSLWEVGDQWWEWVSGKTGKMPKKVTAVLPTSLFKATKRIQYNHPDPHSLRGCIERLATVMESYCREWGVERPAT